MGAYDSNTGKESAYGGEARAQWKGPVAVGNLTERMGGLGMRDSSVDSLFQVRKAVEDAENTIKHQLGEISQLRGELLRKTKELELLDRYKLDTTASLRSSAGATRDEHPQSPYKTSLTTFPLGNDDDRIRWSNNGTSSGPRGALVIHQNGATSNEDPLLQGNAMNHHFLENKGNGCSKIFPGGQTGVDNVVTSQFSSPSSRSISPNRHQKEAEYVPRLNSSSHGLMQVTEISGSSSLIKQDLILKVREHEEEILQLRRHLADFSMKEAQIRNEKYVLEKRIAHMRMAFDQQQQDLVDAASKALSYRQEIIEENIRLTYALQAAQQERSTFVSSLMPLLADYNLQPPVSDAMSIVSNLKVLFKHLEEKLIIIEEKLRDSQYQLAPWHAEAVNNIPQSPSRSTGGRGAVPTNKGLEIVPQPPYSHAQSPISSPNAQTRTDWEGLGHQTLQSGSSDIGRKNTDHESIGKSSPSASSADLKNQNPSFKDLVRSNEADESDAARVPHGREPSVHWGGFVNSPYLPSGVDEASSPYHLPPVLEEPGSSFSEGAEDDPLPAIEGLQISGEAFPGRELQACGYSINGTTTCNFEWVRHLENGSVNYIEGAKQPKYLVTADDVDSYIAIEVQPLDDRKRKGELVRVFANEQRKITCDPEMQDQIERILGVGHESFEVSLSAGVLNIWERAILAIKREGYSIKCNGTRGVVVTEKFSPNTSITILYGDATEFVIHVSSGVEYVLKANDSPMRDTIVLTMRLFIMRAIEKRRGRRRGIFFK